MKDMRRKRRIRVRFLTRVCLSFFFAAFFLKLTPLPVQAKCYSGTVNCHCVCRAYNTEEDRIYQIYTPGSRDVDTKHPHWYGGTCIPTKGANFALGLCTNSYANNCKILCEFWLTNNLDRILSKKASYSIMVESGDKVKFEGRKFRTEFIGYVSR